MNLFGLTALVSLEFKLRLSGVFLALPCAISPADLFFSSIPTVEPKCPIDLIPGVPHYTLSRNEQG